MVRLHGHPHMIDIKTHSPDKNLVSNASLDQIKKAIRDLYTSSTRRPYISLFETPSELELTIYTSAVVLNWYAKGPYDGPGGSTELFSGRVKEWVV
jgi:hypothetical protein